VGAGWPRPSQHVLFFYEQGCAWLRSKLVLLEERLPIRIQQVVSD